MSPTYTLRVAINGSETDEDVEADSEDWLCKLGSVKTSEGGGSWVSDAEHAACTFTVQIPLTLAPLVRTITLAVEGPYNETDRAAAAFWNDNGDGTYYRIVFHGYVTAAKTDKIQRGYIEFAARSEMQGLYERRARLAASSNTGPRSIAQAIETAHSLTIGNDTAIPTSSDFYNLDQPKQGPASNGEWLRTAMAGTGMTIVGEWEGTITAPELCWRTDYPWNDVSMPNYRNAYAGRPWVYEYPSIGFNWQQFVAEVEVTGEQGNTLDHAGWVRYSNLRHMGPRPSTRIIDVSNGTRYWGTAQLGSSTMRRLAGNQTYSINSWIDTAAECETAAKWILKHIGEPSYLRMNAVGFWPDQVAAEADPDPLFDLDASDYGMDHATLVIGDQLEQRGYGGAFDDSNGIGGDNVYGTWPDHCPVDGPVYDELYALWAVALENNGSGGVETQLHTIRSISREWTPSGGWHIIVGLEPDATVAIADSDHGTF